MKPPDSTVIEPIAYRVSWPSYVLGNKVIKGEYEPKIEQIRAVWRKLYSE
jgi:hypothetical protein